MLDENNTVPTNSESAAVSEATAAVETLAPSSPAEKSTPAEKPIVKLDDFNEYLDKPAEQKPVEQPKPKIETQPKPQQKQQPKARDFSSFPAEMHPLLRNMSNEAFDKFKEVYADRESLKTSKAEIEAKLKDQPVKLTLPDSYYENPKGYMLLPEFEEAQQLVDVSRTIRNHWVKQLEKIEAGEDWTSIDWNEQGQLVESAPQPASPINKAQVLNALSYCTSQQQQQEQNLHGIIGNFQSRHKETLSSVTALENRYFPGFTEAELAKPEKAEAKKALDAAYKEMPPILRKSIGAPLLAKSYAAIVGLLELVKQRDAEIETLKLSNKDKQQQPIKETNVGNTQKSKISLKDFDEYKD